MFGLETFITVVVLGVILVAGSIFERNLARMKSPRPGLILPVLAGALALILSIQNFIIAFKVSFSLASFAAALIIYIFYMVPSIVFVLIYLEERRRMELRQKERQRRNRAAKRQQVYRRDSALQDRFQRTGKSPSPIRPVDRPPIRSSHRPRHYS